MLGSEASASDTILCMDYACRDLDSEEFNEILRQIEYMGESEMLCGSMKFALRSALQQNMIKVGQPYAMGLYTAGTYYPPSEWIFLNKEWMIPEQIKITLKHEAAHHLGIGIDSDHWANFMGVTRGPESLAEDQAHRCP